MQATSVHVLAALALLAGCQAASSSRTTPKAQIDELVKHGQFREAVERSAELAAARPGDEKLARLHQESSVAYQLARGRALTFDGQFEDALVEFEKAVAIDPGSREARTWLRKTREKIGARWYDRAYDLHSSDELVAALEAYEKALEYDPNLNLAREGAGRVVIQLNYREGLSEDYYNEGVRSYNAYKLFIAKNRFVYAGHYRPGYEKAARRVSEVDRQISLSRTAIARTLEEEGRFTASRNEYLVATLLDEANEEAQAGYERMVIEADAKRLLKDGEMRILRGEFPKAREILEEGLALTEMQTEEFENVLGRIDDARMARLYQLALDYEHDFRFPLAIETYDTLLEERGWYEDARARKGTLEDYVARAADLYQRALATDDSGKRKEFLQQIEVFWPEYEDVRERLDALK